MLAGASIATRPITAFPRKTYGPVSARLVAAGTAALVAVTTGLARSAVTSAGNGAVTFGSDNGKGVLSVAGVGTMSAPMSALAGMVLLGAGVGGGVFPSIVIARMAFTSNALATFTPVITAKVSSNINFQGSGVFNGSNTPGYVAEFFGSSSFGAVGYALYDDAEKSGPAYEQRVTYIPGEMRTAVAPSEDRVYYVSSKSAPPGPPNRRRVL